MAEGKPIALMVGLVLLLILAAFVLVQFGVLDDFLQNNSNTVTIDSKADMHQLILYDSTIAYVCSDEKGGFYRTGALAWESFESFKKNDGPVTPWTFADIKDALPASKSLVCYGSTEVLPTRGVLAGGDKWINDQEGKFSKMSFSIEKDITLGSRNGCFGFKGGEFDGDSFSDTAFIFSDKNSPNLFKFAFGQPEEVKDCKGFKGSEANSGPLTGKWMKGGKPNVLSPVTVMASGSNLNSQKNLEGEVSGVDNAGWFTGDHNIKKFSFKLCEGTRGYIQTNTGGNKNVDGTTGNHQNPGYTPENPPGFSDKEKAGKKARQENLVHPFIVITKNGC